MVRPRSSLSVFSAVVLVKVSVVWFCCKASLLAARHCRFSPIKVVSDSWQVLFVQQSVLHRLCFANRLVSAASKMYAIKNKV